MCPVGWQRRYAKHLEGSVRARIATSIALAAALAATLAGCNFVTPQASLEPYEPSDGVSASVGDVDVRNAMIISEDGISGNLVFHAINSGSSDVELLVQYEVAGTKTDITIDLPADTTTDVGYGGDGQVFMNGILEKPGGLLALYFQYGDKVGHQVEVPVLDGSLPEYTDLIPTPTPAPTIPPVASPSPTATTTP